MSSSRDKRRSILLNPFGFGSTGTKTPTGSASSNKSNQLHSYKQRTILLPKDNDIISEADVPKRNTMLSTSDAIPQLPPLKSKVKLPVPTVAVISNGTTETREKPATTIPPKQEPVQTTYKSMLDPVKSIQSTLSDSTRSESPATQVRRNLRRKPPPQLPVKPETVTTVIPPVEAVPETNESTKPNLNKLVTNIAASRSDLNLHSGVSESPVPSSVYSPHSAFVYGSNSNVNNVRTSSNLKLVESEEELSVVTTDDENIQRINRLLQESQQLNETVDDHLTHSRQTSTIVGDDEIELLKTKSEQLKQRVENYLSHSRHTSNNDNYLLESRSLHLIKTRDSYVSHARNLSHTVTNELPTIDNSEDEQEQDSSVIQKDPAITDLNSIVREKEPQNNVIEDLEEFTLLEPPLKVLSGKLNSSSQFDTTDDEFYDAENGEQKDSSKSSHKNFSGEDDMSHPFGIISGVPKPVDQSEVVDRSSRDDTPEPRDEELMPPSSFLRNQFSMDAVNGHGSSDVDNTPFMVDDDDDSISVDYEGGDYLLGDDDDDLQDRYISQQEEFFQNHHNLSPETYVNHSPIYDESDNEPDPVVEYASDNRSMTNNVTSKYEDIESSDHESEEEEKLSFTAKSPFYSPFEYGDDSPPRRMIITNNVSDMESEESSEVKINLRDVTNKRNSFFEDEYTSEQEIWENPQPSYPAPTVPIATTLQVPKSAQTTMSENGSTSPVITPSEGQSFSYMYDRREEAVVTPVAYSDPTSSAINPATSPGSTFNHLSDSTNSANAQKKTKLPPRRRPPPDFPVTGRNGRSVSVNQQQLPVFVDNTPIVLETKLAPSTNTMAAPQQKVIHPGEGVKSAYVMAIRKKAGTSYSEIGPPKWTLPVAIRSETEKNKKVALHNKYSKTTMSLFKKGVLSSADIKHGNLKPRLLASEVDDDELTKITSPTSTTTGSSLLHTQLGSMIPPGFKSTNDLNLVYSKSNSLYSATSNASLQHRRQSSLLNSSINDELDFEDYLVQDFKGNHLPNAKLNDISELNRAASVRSYLPGANPGGKLKLFVVNPDGDSP